MKNYILPLSATLFLAGCNTTQAGPSAKLKSTNCNYEEIDSPIFKLNESSQKYASIYFYETPKGKYSNGYMGDEAKKLPIVSNGFKFTGKANIDPKSRYVEWNEKISSDGIPVKLKYGSSGSKSQIIGADCQSYWFDTSNALKAFEKELTLERLNYVYGSENVEVLNIADKPAKVVRDKFKKNITIRGTEFNNVFFRMWGDYDTNALSNTVQLYTIHTTSDWLFLSKAYDEDGNKRKTTEIDRDTASCGQYGCSLKEHVGITFPISYLRTKADTGFEVKVSGSRGERIVKVLSGQVKQILNSYDNFE